MDHLDLDHNSLPLAAFCRTCLTKDNLSADGSNMVSLFDAHEKTGGRSPNELLVELSFPQFKVTPEDGLPPNICLNCLDKLTFAHSFRQQCYQVQKFYDRYQLIPVETMKSEQDALIFKGSNNDFALEQAFSKTEHEDDDFQNDSSTKEKQSLECPVCRKSFQSVSNRNSHLQLHDDHIYECELCDLTFKSRAYLKRHSKTVHTTANHSCDQCDATFTSTVKYEYHLKKHEPLKKFRCSYCTKSFLQQHHLLNHERVHTGKEPYLCNVCGKAFRHEPSFRTHLKIHDDARQYVCKLCSKSFVQRSTYLQHVAKHRNDRSFQCEQCGKKFVQRAALIIHFKTHSVLALESTINQKEIGDTHSKFGPNLKSEESKTAKVKSLPYICEICNKAFKLPSSLTSHLKVHSEERKYICQDCGNTFKRVEHLRIHVNAVHLKKKPYSCDICDRTFAQSGDRNVHMRRHTEDKPFQCDYCNKSFRLAKALRAHMRLHTGEKPFVCVICNTSFISYMALDSHTQKQHMETMDNHFLSDHVGSAGLLNFTSHATATTTIATVPIDTPLNHDSMICLATESRNSDIIPENGLGTVVDSVDGVVNNPRIVYLDRVCRTCLIEKEKDQLKDLYDFCLVDTLMACVGTITIEESDGLPSHICLACLQEVDRILSFRQQCEKADQAIRNLIEKSVVIKQDSETKYEVLNVVLTDANGNTETSAVVVPIEELRFQLMNGGATSTGVCERTAQIAIPSKPEAIELPVMELNEAMDLSAPNQEDGTEPLPIAIAKTSLEYDGFPTPTELLIPDVETIAEDGDSLITVNPSELLNESVPTSALVVENEPLEAQDEDTNQQESTILKNLKQELSEFISDACAGLSKDQDLDDNDDDEMIHVDYLKDALTEEYIQTMEKQLASSAVPKSSGNPAQDRLEQENLDSLINDHRLVVNDEGEQEHDQQLDCSVEVLESELDPRNQHVVDSDSRCKICDKTFDSESQLRKHMKKHSDKHYDCTYCFRKFADQSQLRNHLVRHKEGKMHPCKHCDASFEERSMLTAHIKSHANERPHACETCGKRFNTKSLLSTHQKIHTGEKSHICTTCGKGFTLSWQLKAHTRVHTNEKPFECPYCQKRFNQNGNLMIHIRIHTGERPFKCTQCEKAYPSQGELSVHMRQHTGEKKAKKIICSICQKGFAGKGDLKIHMRTHTKEKPYGCQLCGRSFMLHVHLVVHMRSHTGERPYACTLCEKAFATNYQLKNHTYVHTGEKNFACDVCNRRFSSSANRNTHRKTHDRKIS
ncbi:uncharacterized protein LOC129753637 [Uranotaenia lowii]|uniref:uncharacterized protein LOC129753637 n=1 Tax=Uranotaenia lowii TaxID=190385 RepID=UPI00247A2119|nr:uncharacterized protein LOC129753637 [Uranotaenia lowii]